MIAHSCGVPHARELRREHVRIVQANGQSCAQHALSVSGAEGEDPRRMMRLFSRLALVASGLAAGADLHQQPVGTRVCGVQVVRRPSTFRRSYGVPAARNALHGSWRMSRKGRSSPASFCSTCAASKWRARSGSPPTWTRTGASRPWLPTEDPCKVRADIHLHKEPRPELPEPVLRPGEPPRAVPGPQEGMGAGGAWLGSPRRRCPCPRQWLRCSSPAFIARFPDPGAPPLLNPEADGFAPSKAAKWNVSESHRDRLAQDPARRLDIQSYEVVGLTAASPVYAGFTDARPKGAFPQPPFPAKRSPARAAGPCLPCSVRCPRPQPGGAGIHADREGARAGALQEAPACAARSSSPRPSSAATTRASCARISPSLESLIPRPRSSRSASPSWRSASPRTTCRRSTGGTWKPSTMRARSA